MWRKNWRRIKLRKEKDKSLKEREILLKMRVGENRVERKEQTSVKETIKRKCEKERKMK